LFSLGLAVAALFVGCGEGGRQSWPSAVENLGPDSILLIGSDIAADLDLAPLAGQVVKIARAGATPGDLLPAVDRIPPGRSAAACIVLVGENVFSDLGDLPSFLGVRLFFSERVFRLFRRPDIRGCPCPRPRTLPRGKLAGKRARHDRRLGVFERDLGLLTASLKSRGPVILASPPFRVELCPGARSDQPEEVFGIVEEACAKKAAGRSEEAFGLFLIARDRMLGPNGGVLAINEIVEAVAGKQQVAFLDLQNLLLEKASDWTHLDRLFAGSRRLNEEGRRAVSEALLENLSAIRLRRR